MASLLPGTNVLVLIRFFFCIVMKSGEMSLGESEIAASNPCA